VDSQGFAIVAFRADNPGVWFFHCHIEFHVLIGMVAQFVEAPDVMQRTLVIPPVIREQCGKQGFPTFQDEGNGSSSEQEDASTEIQFQRNWWDEFVSFFRSLFRL